MVYVYNFPIRFLYFLTSLIFNTKNTQGPIHTNQMYTVRTSYKTLAQYDLDRMLQQRRNLSKVESQLSLYQKSNHNLSNQVHQLVRQNQLLRQQVQHISPQRSQISESNLKRSILKTNPYLQVDKSTIKKQNPSRYSNNLNHPRNAYMTPVQAQLLNMKMYKQAKTAYKKYDGSKDYEQFKEKLSERKKELKSSYKKTSNFEASRLEMSRNVYLEEPSFSARQRQPLNQLKRQNHNASPKLDKKLKEEKQISPYLSFKKNSPYHSPERNIYENNEKRKDTQRSCSAVKIEDPYLQNSIKIAQPKTKWGDLSSTYFDRSKLIKNDQNDQKGLNGQNANEDFDQKLMQSNLTLSKNGKSKKKRFLNVVSQSTLQEKEKLRKV